MQLSYGFLGTLVFFLFNGQLLLWDEEFLVALCLLGLYAFIFFTGRKLLRFAFFHKAEVIYFYFYFLLQLLGTLGSSVEALLTALLVQWESFYGLQLSLFLAHWLDSYVVQWKGRLSQGFLFSSFGLIFVCYTLSSGSCPEASLEDTWGGPLVALGEAGAENDDVEPSGAEAPALEVHDGPSGGDGWSSPEVWYQPGLWSQEDHAPLAPEVLGSLWLKSMGL